MCLAQLSKLLRLSGNSETLVGDASCPTEQATPPIRKPRSEMCLAQLSKLLLLSGNSETLVGDVSCATEQATPPIRKQ